MCSEGGLPRRLFEPDRQFDAWDASRVEVQEGVDLVFANPEGSHEPVAPLPVADRAQVPEHLPDLVGSTTGFRPWPRLAEGAGGPRCRHWSASGSGRR